MLTREELDKAFERAIATSKSMEEALTDPAIGDLASVLSAIGDVKSDPVYEAVSTAIYSYLAELQRFNLAFSAAPSLKRDLEPKVANTLSKFRSFISKLREELLKESPNYKTILEATGNIFFEYHRLYRIRSAYPTG